MRCTAIITNWSAGSHRTHRRRRLRRRLQLLPKDKAQDNDYAVRREGLSVFSLELRGVEQDADTCAVGVRGCNVRLAIVIEIGHGDQREVTVDSERLRLLECSIAVAQQDGDGARAFFLAKWIVPDHEVWNTVAVEV